MKRKLLKRTTIATLSLAGLFGIAAPVIVNNLDTQDNSFVVGNDANSYMTKIEKSYISPQQIMTLAEIEQYLPGISTGRQIKIIDGIGTFGRAVSNAGRKYINQSSAEKIHLQLQEATDQGTPGKFYLRDSNSIVPEAGYMHASKDVSDGSSGFNGLEIDDESEFWKADTIEAWFHKGEILFIPKTRQDSLGIVGDKYYDVTDPSRPVVQAETFFDTFPPESALDNWNFKFEAYNFVHESLSVEPANITAVSANVNATFTNGENNSEGDSEAVEARLIYTPEGGSPIEAGASPNFDGVNGTASWDLTGLEPGKNYTIYVQYFNSNGDLILSSPEETFMTLDVAQPGGIVHKRSGKDFMEIELVNSFFSPGLVKSFEIFYEEIGTFDWISSGPIPLDSSATTADGVYRINNLEQGKTYRIYIKYNFADPLRELETDQIVQKLDYIQHNNPGVINPDVVDSTWDSLTFNVDSFDPLTSSFNIDISEIKIKETNQGDNEWVVAETFVDTHNDPSLINKDHKISNLKANTMYDVKISHYHNDQYTGKTLLSETDVRQFATIPVPNFNAGFLMSNLVDFNSIEVSLNNYDNSQLLVPARAEFQYTKNDSFDDGYDIGKTLYGQEIQNGNYKINEIDLEAGVNYKVRLTYFDSNDQVLGMTNVQNIKTDESIQFQKGVINFEDIKSDEITLSLNEFQNSGNGLVPFDLAIVKYKETDSSGNFKTLENVDLTTTDPNKFYVASNLEKETEYEFKVEYWKNGVKEQETDIFKATTLDEFGAPIRGDIEVSNISRDSLNVIINNFEQGVTPELLVNKVSIQLSSDDGKTWKEKKVITDLDAVNGVHEITGLNANTNYQIKIVYLQDDDVIRETIDYVEIKTKSWNWLAIGGTAAGIVVFIGLVIFFVVRWRKKQWKRKLL